jgi:hypothetical protein
MENLSSFSPAAPICEPTKVMGGEGFQFSIDSFILGNKRGQRSVPIEITLDFS